MTVRKEKYTFNDHDVTIQKTNEHSDVHAWIDGWAVSRKALQDDTTTIHEDITKLLDMGVNFNAMKLLVNWMAQNDVYYCGRCEAFYDHKNVSGTGFAGHICGACASEKARCSESPDGRHSDTCTNPRQKHNARVATRYRCDYCNRLRATTPTG